MDLAFHGRATEFQLKNKELIDTGVVRIEELAEGEDLAVSRYITYVHLFKNVHRYMYLYIYIYMDDTMIHEYMKHVKWRELNDMEVIRRREGRKLSHLFRLQVLSPLSPPSL